VTLTQSLGGNYTVIFNGNMARVDGRDADALGLPIETLEFPQSSDDTIDPSQVDQALASVYDPEIPVNIVDLGLIYSVKVAEDGVVDIQMTLTAPGCGMGPVLIEDVKTRVTAVPNVRRVDVELVFDPPWSRDRMSEEAQLELGLF
jgi:probable FeS assembly SUF system protein SufT